MGPEMIRACVFPVTVRKNKAAKKNSFFMTIFLSAQGKSEMKKPLLKGTALNMLSKNY